METVPFEETWMLLVAQIAALHFDETQLYFFSAPTHHSVLSQNSKK